MVLKLGIDGYVNALEELEGSCCPPTLCSISERALQCNFVNLLPSGPMWDAAKNNFFSGNINGTSMADVAAFIASVLFDVINNALWPSIRESDPRTAYTSIDDWLEKLNWKDCYGLCRNRQLTILSPFEVMGVCGPIDCRPEISAEFQLAWNYAILHSLSRLSLRPLATIDSLNAIIEPLGAVASALEVESENPCAVKERCIQISVLRNELILPTKDCGSIAETVPSYIDLGCDRPAGMQQYIWPTIMSAECIARAFLPRKGLCIKRIECSDELGD